MILLIVITIIKYLWLYYPDQSLPIDFANIKWEKLNNKDYQTPEKSNKGTYRKNFAKTQEKVINQERLFGQANKSVSLFAFDPNRIDQDSLNMLPINRYAKENILKYRSRGGQFRIAEDLQKIYALTAKEYERIKPFIRIPVYTQTSTFLYNKSNKMVDINTASADQLKSLKGIGPVLSKRIVKYRKKLGGFIDIRQLKEVYGLPDSTFIAIAMRLEISKEIQKIKINMASYKDLSSHPYINNNIASVIVKYRQMHSEYTDEGDLLNIKIIDQAFLNKIIPYISFE